VSRGAWIGVFVGVITLGLGLSVLTALATQDGGSTTTSATTTSGSSVAGPFDLPLALRSDALALAQHRRDLLIGLAAKPGGPVEIAAVRAEDPIPAADVKISVDGFDVQSEACGRGCSRIQAPVLSGRSIGVTVHVGSSSVRFSLPRRLPPSGAGPFERARRTMGALSSYHFTERLSSGHGAIFTQLDVQAPDRLRLRTNTGFRSVIIGKTRWDFLDGRWERARFPGLAVRDVLMWYHANTPRIVGREANGDVKLAGYGRKPVPAWFRLTVERSGRVTEAEMTASSHFMLHRYSAFDRGAQITPPR
jgi:hypothetical protein